MDEPGIALEANLPFEWKPEPAPSASITARRRHDNIVLLRALCAMEGALREYEHDMPDTVGKHLDRLESKLDILLSMIASLMRESTALPAEKAVRLYADRVTWQEDAPPPQIGQTLLLRLFPDPRLPQPLLLGAVVVESTPADDGKVRLVALLQDRDPDVEEWLTRTIFRHHRRTLHAQRQP
jgi:hypothetical protein